MHSRLTPILRELEGGSVCEKMFYQSKKIPPADALLERMVVVCRRPRSALERDCLLQRVGWLPKLPSWLVRSSALLVGRAKCLLDPSTGKEVARLSGADARHARCEEEHLRTGRVLPGNNSSSSGRCLTILAYILLVASATL